MQSFTFEQLPQAIGQLYEQLERIEKLLSTPIAHPQLESDGLITIQFAADNQKSGRRMTQSELAHEARDDYAHHLLGLRLNLNIYPLPTMISQEKIYQHVFSEEWEPIITLLHQHRKDIASDPLLTQAAIIFEHEFFKKIDGYPISQTGVLPVLENLYVLQAGKFYQLQVANNRKLHEELVKRLSLKVAYDYAKAIPDNESAKNVIKQYEAQLAIDRWDEQMRKIPANWTEIYNRLYEMMNTQGPTYFSGPTFFRVINEFQPYHADYTQYMQIRTAQGKSNTRKIYFYDVFMELDDQSRSKSIARLLDHLRPFEPAKVEKIESLLGWMSIASQTTKLPPIEAGTIDPNSNVTNVNPIVFISYSWDNEDHKQWVLDLADRLVGNGVEVILDRYALRAGNSIPYFIETSINRAHRIIIVFTPNYKLKADNRMGGVGYEYSIMNAELYGNQTTDDKIIPILRKGIKSESIPTFMQQFIHIDISSDENFEISYTDLLREIYNEPAIQRPPIGVKPEFEIRNT